MAAVLLLRGAGVSCAATAQSNPREHYPHVIRMDEMLALAADKARRASARRPAASAQEPAYIDALLADGRLSIGLGIGTEDLGAVRLPPQPQLRRFRGSMRICGRPVLVDARLILTREDFRQGLAECEILFVTSHSRFGAGPVFLQDGKAYPFLMQTTPGYEIVMPDEEICGFSGKIKRRFYSRERGKYYTVFLPDGSDLDAASPLRGYQMLVLSTCTSKKHFADEIKSFRSLYPTTAILTRRAAFLDPGMNVFMRFLAQVFQGRDLPDIVAAMNQEYRDVAQRHVQSGSRTWRVVDNMYLLGLQTLP